MFGLMAGLWFVLVVGFAKLSVVIVNRLLAKPRPKRLVRVLEFIQVSLIPLYAAALYQPLLSESAPQLQNILTADINALCGIGLIGIGGIGLGLLINSAIAYQRYRPPACEVSADSKRIDYREDNTDDSWKHLLVGTGGMRPIAMLPGNEQFSVEVSTKTYQLPRLPAEWDGLSIVHFADLHFYHSVTRKYFELVCEEALALKPDLYVFTGDLLDDMDYLDWFPDTLGRLKAPLGQYFILGNHDWYLDANAVRSEFRRHGWIDLASRSIKLESPTSKSMILLAGDETPWMGTHPVPDPKTEDLFRILLSHTPDNITWARKNGFDLMLAGHTHGGQIRLPVLGPVYSPSAFDVRFASGVFWLDPTLLYVSRGLSGREPIRYQCPPELNKLVLHRRRD